MDILNIRIDKDRNLDVKNSPECKIVDLMSLVICLIVEISKQTGKPKSKVIRDTKRLYKKHKGHLK